MCRRWSEGNVTRCHRHGTIPKPVDFVGLRWGCDRSGSGETGQGGTLADVMKISPIRHTWSGDFAIGYQTVGDGTIDLLDAAPWASNLDWNWRWDHRARFLRRLGSFSRLILFDPRGWGVSDRHPPGVAPSLEDRAADMSPCSTHSISAR
jgi:hypothetical protein